MYADLASKVGAVAAVVIGALWALRLYRMQRTSKANLQVSVVPDVVRIDGEDERRLIRVNITLKNIGRVRSQPGPCGCVFRVWQLSRHAQKTGVLVEWDRPGHYPREPIGAQAIVSSLDVFRPYKKGLYGFEPGVEYHEMEALFAQKGNILLIEVGLSVETDDDGVTEYRLVSVD